MNVITKTCLGVLILAVVGFAAAPALNMVVNGNVTADHFFGNGENLTGISTISDLQYYVNFTQLANYVNFTEVVNYANYTELANYVNYTNLAYYANFTHLETYANKTYAAMVTMNSQLINNSNISAANVTNDTAFVGNFTFTNNLTAANITLPANNTVTVQIDNMVCLMANCSSYMYYNSTLQAVIIK